MQCFIHRCNYPWHSVYNWMPCRTAIYFIRSSSSSLRSSSSMDSRGRLKLSRKQYIDGNSFNIYRLIDFINLSKSPTERIIIRSSRREGEFSFLIRLECVPYARLKLHKIRIRPVGGNAFICCIKPPFIV